MTAFPNLEKLAVRLRDDFKSAGKRFVLLYAYNGTGKTRLSMEFKSLGKKKQKGNADTLYFNAFTEDLFTWENDFKEDKERKILVNKESKFFNGLESLEMDNRIRRQLSRYADFDFRIDTETWTVVFSRDEEDYIKISRGEEHIFIWCFFLSIAEIALDSSIDVYDWVKYIYIYDPISSLDEHNTVRVACQLAEIFRDANPEIGVVISTHHTLFFNVLFNELKRYKTKQYFLHRSALKSDYLLAPTHDTPFMQHVAQLAELRQITQDGQLYTHHFNALRSIMERTATFLGYHDFSVCLKGFGDEGLAARALNLLSHGSHSIYEPSKMQDDNKKLFKEILDHFMSIYSFALPAVFVEAQTAPETT